MRFGIYGCDLASAVNKVSKALATKSTNPILEGIRIATTGDYVVFTATDLEIGIETRVKCEVFEGGETVVVGKAFIEYANKLTQLDYVEITSDGKQVKIKCGKIKLALSEMNEKDFPKLNKDFNGNGVEIETSDLIEVINGTAFSCATDEARPILKGCLFEVSDNKLNVCALDGFRLALKTCTVNNVNCAIKSVVPMRSLLELIRLIGEEKTINLVFQNGLLLIKTEDTIFTTRLLNGDFINYSALLASGCFTSITIDKKELFESLDRLSILAKSTNNIVRCVVDNGTMTLTTNSEFGNAEDTIEVQQDGRLVELHFNYRYLIDCLKAIKDECVKLCFGKDNKSPFFVLPNNNSDYKYLILPIRVNVSN